MPHDAVTESRPANHNSKIQSKETVRATDRKMCGGVTAARLRLILARGSLRPPLHPPEQGLRPLHPTRRAFVPSKDLQTGRDFSLDPLRPWALPRGPAPDAFRPCTPDQPCADWMPETFRGFIPTKGGGPLPSNPPQPCAGWMRGRACAPCTTPGSLAPCDPQEARPL